MRSSEIRSQLGWSTLVERRAEHKCIMINKILVAQAPTYLKQHFLHGSIAGEYYLRKMEL